MATTKVTTGGITDATIATADIANDAVTSAKIAHNNINNNHIATNSVQASQIQSSAVTEAKIADEAVTLAKLPHGTSSNDGKFLRANNGADPSFETVTSVGGGTGVDFNDDIKARFGTGNDIEIYHSSDQSYIKNSTGNLRIETDALRLRSKTGTENYLKADVNGAVEVYHDNSKKLETASTGATVTGALALAASSGDNPTINNADGGNGNNMYFNTGGGAKLILQNDGHTRPASNNTYDLGTSSDRWRKVYTNGILFNGDTADANKLDDYEEGTWTPTINVGTYGGFLSHIYTKIGCMVYVHGGMTFNNTSSSSEVQISNLPFAGASSQFTGTVWLRRTSTGNKPYVSLIGQNGNSTISVHHLSDGNDMGGGLTYSNFQNSNTYFQYSIWYKTNS